MTQEGGFMATIKEQIQALYDEINKTQKNTGIFEKFFNFSGIRT